MRNGRKTRRNERDREQRRKKRKVEIWRGWGGGDQHTRRQQPSDVVLRTCDWTKLRPTNQSPGIQIIQSPPVVCPAPFLLLHGLHQATGQRTTREEVTNPPLSLLLLQLHYTEGCEPGYFGGP